MQSERCFVTIFDLLLILLVLSTAACVLVVAGTLIFRRWRLAGRLAIAILAVWAVYLGAGAAVAVLTPQHIMHVGEDRCFDEMCFAVNGFHRAATIEHAGMVTKPLGVFMIVDVRISNRGGHAQKENGRSAVIVDQSGQVYRESQAGLQALSQVNVPLSGLDAEVAPGQSLDTKLVFDLPASAVHPAFALGSSLAFNPASIVIADEAHFLHKPTIVPLD
jgi:hypothetical protein